MATWNERVYSSVMAVADPEFPPAATKLLLVPIPPTPFLAVANEAGEVDHEEPSQVSVAAITAGW